MNQYHKLYTPQDSAVVFIDQQPQMTFGMASADRATMINNVTLLAKVAKEFLTQIGVPEERLMTISYGQERPVCTDHNEECWQKNRRAHLTASR